MKIIYKSNFSIKEHISFILSKKNKIGVEEIAIDKNTIPATKYMDYKSNLTFLFFSLTKNISSKENEIPISIFQKIIYLLETKPINRKFIIKNEKNKLILLDILFNKSFEFSIDSKKTFTQITVDSRIFPVFRLNKKTLSRNVKVFKLDKRLIFIFNKKEKFGLSIEM